MRRFSPTDRDPAGARLGSHPPHWPFFRPENFARRWFLVAVALFLSGPLTSATTPPPEYGADPFPGGHPLGGGAGYSAGPAREQAAHRANSFESLQQALALAKPREVVWIEGTIDFTGVRLEVGENITLAGDRGRAGLQGPLLFARQPGTNISSSSAPVRGLPGCVSGARIRF
jgi:hypothetical protein